MPIVLERIFDNEPGSETFGQCVRTIEHQVADVTPNPITRVRFDAVFAGAIGEVGYDNILDALAAVAATTPKTADTVKVKRALRALEQTAGVDFPKTDWRTPGDDDLTGQFLKVVNDVLIGDDATIGDKIDAGLAAWREF